MVKLHAEPGDILLYHVYFPNSQYQDEEVDEVYKMLEGDFRKRTGNDYLVIIGRFEQCGWRGMR